MVNAKVLGILPQERHGTNCKGDWVCPGVDLDMCGNLETSGNLHVMFKESVVVYGVVRIQTR